MPRPEVLFMLRPIAAKCLLCALGVLAGEWGSAYGAAAESGGSAGLQTRDRRYKLQINDVLEIKYRYTPEYDQIVTIQPDNFVNLNLAGDVKAGGLTLEQFRNTVLERVSARLREPELNVVLKSFEKQWVMVGGEVA